MAPIAFTTFMEPLIALVLEYRETTSLPRRLELAEQIFGAVYGPLRTFIERRCPPEAVDDVLHETLRALAAKLHLFRGETEAAFWSWCYQTARHKLADRARGATGRLVPMDVDSLREAVEASAEVSPFGAGEWVDLKETMALLQRVQPPCHDYLVERYLHGATLAELALEHGVSYDAMRMRFNRCLELVQRLTAETDREVTDGH
ncbi:MAG: sigma-70 family RNA polymerase sigma factor [Verrucomicrobiales bacterium]|nr:sigma-70 family RNA polymerase sigma factor [Verrucomicrobiales bacterium]